jgi:hypothetical protein
MPWRGTRYYRSVRINGVARNEYIGAGPVAAAIAHQVAAAREARDLDRVQVDLDRAAAQAIDKAVRRVDALADRLLAVAMAAAGFHRHHRGHWRKRRGR